MNTIFKIKIVLIYFILLCAGEILNIRSANALDPSTTITRNDDECTGNGGIISTPGTTSCELTPDVQKVTFLRLDLCTSKPTGPTTSTAVDRTNCSTFYRRDSGSEVTIKKNISTQIGTAIDYQSLPYGVYTHGIVTMTPTFKFKSSVTFDGNVKDNGDNEGTTCVTKTSSEGKLYGFHNDLTSFAKGNVSCIDGAIAEEISVGINTLTMDEDNDCYHLINFTGTNEIVAAYLLESDGTLNDGVGATDADQIKNSVTGCEASVSNNVDHILGIMPLSLNITPMTNGIQIKYNNTRGFKLDMNGSTSNKFWKFDSAYFDFSLTAR